MASDTRNYHTLDGMRGVGVLVVLLGHSDGTFGLAAAPHGFLAVDFFFALSGFVITHAYGTKLTAGMSFREFLRVRFIRFYPLYLLGAVLGLLTRGAALFRYHHLIPSLALAGLSLTGLPNSSPLHPHQSLYPLDAPAWSLFFEFGINILLVLVWKRLSARLIILFIVVGFVGFVASVPFSTSMGWDWGGFFTGWMRILFSFFIGVALYRWRDRFSALRVNAWAVVAATALLLFMPLPEGTIWSGLYDLAALLIGIPLLLVLGATTEPGAIATPWFKWAGAISYGVYIIHDPLLAWAQDIVSATGIKPMVMIALFVPFIVGLAWLAERFYNQPARRWMSRTFVFRRPAAVPAAA